jgi:hypothetical protein
LSCSNFEIQQVSKCEDKVDKLARFNLMFLEHDKILWYDKSNSGK